MINNQNTSLDPTIRTQRIKFVKREVRDSAWEFAMNIVLQKGI